MGRKYKCWANKDKQLLEKSAYPGAKVRWPCEGPSCPRGGLRLRLEGLVPGVCEGL